MMDSKTEHIECLEEGNPADPCCGPVEYHNTGGARSFPRCQHHAEERLEREMDNRRRYPMLQPADFDPSFAGERWDDDY